MWSPNIFGGRWRGRPSKQKGTEFIEFAITAPVVMLLLFGVSEVSVALFDKATITNASREGAREGIVFFEGSRPDVNAIRSTVTDYLEDRLISFDGDSLDGITAVDIATTDNNGDGCCNAGDDLSVTVNYDYQFFVLPNLSTLFGGGLGSNLTIGSTTLMRFE